MYNLERLYSYQGGRNVGDEGLPRIARVRFAR